MNCTTYVASLDTCIYMDTRTAYRCERATLILCVNAELVPLGYGRFRCGRQIPAIFTQWIDCCRCRCFFQAYLHTPQSNRAWTPHSKLLAADVRQRERANMCGCQNVGGRNHGHRRSIPVIFISNGRVCDSHTDSAILTGRAAGHGPRTGNGHTQIPSHVHHSHHGQREEQRGTSGNY